VPDDDAQTHLWVDLTRAFDRRTRASAQAQRALRRTTRRSTSRVGTATSVEDLDRWLQLAMNIWNTTPQPDRGGASAYELSRRAPDR
jgi:hypothetical protein